MLSGFRSRVVCSGWHAARQRSRRSTYEWNCPCRDATGEWPGTDPKYGPVRVYNFVPYFNDADVAAWSVVRDRGRVVWGTTT